MSISRNKKRSFLEIWLYLTVFALLLGQLLRIPLTEGGTLLPIDLFAILSVLFWVGKNLKKKKFVIPSTSLNLPLVLFLLITSFSFLLNSNLLVGKEYLLGLSYLLRLAGYLLTFFVVIDTLHAENWGKFYQLLILVGLVFASLGFVQLTFIPSFEFMTKYGWDPHIKRLLATFFDPNYAGGFLVFVSALVLGRLLFTENKAEKGLGFFAFLFLVTSVIFTYSRSSYLAFLVMLLTIGLLRSPRLLFVGVMVLLVAFFTFPRMRQRIMSGFSLDATAQMRLANYQQAKQIIDDYPWFGVGYNNLRVVREEYGQIQDPSQHTAGGFDSSFLTVWATTGIIGLLVYLWLCWRILKESFKQFWDKKSPPILRGLGLGIFAGFLSLIVHSQFVNSLFYPHIMLYLIFSLGLLYAKRNPLKEINVPHP